MSRDFVVQGRPLVLPQSTNSRNNWATRRSCQLVTKRESQSLGWQPRTPVTYDHIRRIFKGSETPPRRHEVPSVPLVDLSGARIMPSNATNVKLTLQSEDMRLASIYLSGVVRSHLGPKFRKHRHGRQILRIPARHQHLLFSVGVSQAPGHTSLRARPVGVSDPEVGSQGMSLFFMGGRWSSYACTRAAQNEFLTSLE